MAKIKGVCKNIDDCSKAEKREIQDLEKSASFVCEECGKPLTEIKGKNTSKVYPKHLLGILGVIMVIAILVVFVVRGFGDPPPPVKIEKEREEPTTPTVTEGQQPYVVIDKGDQDTGTGLGSISFDYGKYTGEIKNFKANGTGILQFFKPRRLSLLDKQERMAESKDYVEGLFIDNELSQGTWYDGNKKQKGSVLTGQLGIPADSN